MSEGESPCFLPEQDFVRIGTVLRPQGLQGAIRVQPCTACRENILAYSRVFLAAADEADKREYTVLQARLDKTGAVLSLAGCGNRNEAEMLRGHSLWLHSEDLPQLAEDEFYLHTLMGKEARTADGQMLGRICAVADTAAHPLLVLRSGAEELLVPAIAAFISQVDEKTVVLALPEGLLEINAGR